MRVLAVIFAVLVVILSRPAISKLLASFLRDRKELIFYALFVAAEVALTVVLVAVLGPRIGVIALIAAVALFLVWATRPPAQRR